MSRLWLLLSLLIAPFTRAEQTVLKLTVHDTIQPITVGYIERGLRHAAEEHAAAVLLSLGTPGGLLDSTRAIVTAIERSPVPVIVSISPTGSRAGSAGFFLLVSADLAVMAPGTNAGAAHPVVEGKPLDPIMAQKLEDDTAAWLRSLVTRRGRNPEAAEDAVRHSKSYSDTEALKLHLIDLVAPDDRSVLNATPGLTLHRFDGTALHLDLAGARIVELPPSTRERLLSRLADPDLAVLLLILGGLLVYLESNIPGTIVPGALGTLMVLLALFGLNLLPIRHTAVLLLAAAAVLILLEAKFASHGVLALAGTAALVFGLATLVDAPGLEVHWGTALGAGAGFGLISFLLASIALRARRAKRLLGPQAMLGAPAIARTALAPTGQIEVRGELWRATLKPKNGEASAGSALRVTALDPADSLLLVVELLP